MIWRLQHDNRQLMIVCSVLSSYSVYWTISWRPKSLGWVFGVQLDSIEKKMSKTLNREEDDVICGWPHRYFKISRRKFLMENTTFLIFKKKIPYWKYHIFSFFGKKYHFGSTIFCNPYSFKNTILYTSYWVNFGNNIPDLKYHILRKI